MFFKFPSILLNYKMVVMPQSAQGREKEASERCAERNGGGVRDYGTGGEENARADAEEG